MTKQRPTLFIGSSSEGLKIAEAIQMNLDRSSECVLWNQGVFGLMGGTLETLVNKVGNFDFAVLVLTPDDLLISKDSTEACARDNVLFELGLFIGAIGRVRTFAVYDRTSGIRLPSDLAGVTLATFQPHKNGNLQAALGAFCTQIKESIEKMGLRPRIDPNVSLPINEQYQIITDLLGPQDLQFLIVLKDIDFGIPRDFESDYKFAIKRIGVRGKGERYCLDDLCRKLPDAGLLQQDLRNNVSLTNRGREYVSWLIDHGYKAESFECSLCEWGLPVDI